MIQKPPNAIIFDLVGVLFSINKFRALRSVRISEMIGYYWRNGKSPYDFSFALLDKMRREMPGEFQETVAYNGTYLPKSLSNWQQGLLSTHETFARVVIFFDQLEAQGYFKSVQDKKVICDTIETMLNTNLRADIMQPIAATCLLVDHLRKQHTHLKLYILSNIDTELISALKHAHKEIFAQFDGIITSCETKKLKPHPEIFDHLLATYNLKPHDCVFIDDQQENLTTAHNLGMKIIHCTKKTNLKKSLKKLHIL